MSNNDTPKMWTPGAIKATVAYEGLDYIVTEINPDEVPDQDLADWIRVAKTAFEQIRQRIDALPDLTEDKEKEDDVNEDENELDELDEDEDDDFDDDEYDDDEYDDDDDEYDDEYDEYDDEYEDDEYDDEDDDEN